MRYLSVTETAKKWNVSECGVRNYCAHGRVNGTFLTGKTWNIPEHAEKPERSRIPGAIKFGRDWAIPEDAERPIDKRVVTGQYKDYRKRTERQILSMVI